VPHHARCQCYYTACSWHDLVQDVTCMIVNPVTYVYGSNTSIGIFSYLRVDHMHVQMYESGIYLSENIHRAVLVGLCHVWFDSSYNATWLERSYREVHLVHVMFSLISVNTRKKKTNVKERYLNVICICLSKHLFISYYVFQFKKPQIFPTQYEFEYATYIFLKVDNCQFFRFCLVCKKPTSTMENWTVMGLEKFDSYHCPSETR
jgi:hypothetical protein